MDSSPTRWSTPAAAVMTCWLCALAAAAAAGLVTRHDGQLLLAIAAAVLTMLALHGTLARPRLAVDADYITVRGITGTKRLARDTVDVRVRQTRRFGRLTSTLELSSGETLVVLGRIDLGTDPDDVAEVLLCRSTGGRRG